MASLDEISLLAGALARYWRDYPFASDSCDGIARWWLALPPGWTVRLQRALDWMVEQGVVERVQAADGRVRYRRRREAEGSNAIDEALRHMADVGGPNNGPNSGKGNA